MQRNYSWLEIAEYLSIIASLIGSIAAVATHKAVLMAAPMSISLILNLLHRRKLLDLGRKRIGAEVAEQKQLKQAIAALPLEQIEACLLRLCQQVEQQQIEISQLMVNIEKVSDKIPLNITALPGHIDAIQQQVDRINYPELISLKAEISSIEYELAMVSDRLNQIHQDTESMVPKKNLKQIIYAIKALDRENVDVRASIAQLNQAVTRVCDREKLPRNLSMESLTVPGNSKSHSQNQCNNCLQQISDLRGSLAELTRAIAVVERETEQIVPPDALRSLISDMIATQLPESISLQPTTTGQFLSLDSFSPNSGAVNSNLNGGGNGFNESSDVYSIPQLHREIENLSEEIASLETQMENRLAPLEAIDRHAIEEDLSLQAQAIAQLQQQTSKLLKLSAGSGQI